MDQLYWTGARNCCGKTAAFGFPLLTLTGAGGVGKTRLALQVGYNLVESFKDGVWLVELAPLSDPALVVQTIATTLGLSEHPGRPLLMTLEYYLRSRHLLLILDNCEHLIEECARVMDSLLRTSKGLHVLATSRESLAISGEVNFRVPSLSLPDPYSQIDLDEGTLLNYEGINLFIERARAANPSFSLTVQNAGAVVQVCRHLDGISLAIELAAARVKMLPVSQLASRLDDRFRLLTDGSRTALPRQQTLKALVDWSYELLTPAEQVLLARLSVFAGGWSLNAAEEVCGSNQANENGAGLERYEVLDALSGLVNKSLVQVEEADNGEARYFFLETIRQYGQEKLKARGEEQNLCQRHLDFFATLVSEIIQKAESSDQVQVLKDWDRELDNIRACIEFGLKEDQVEKVINFLFHFYWDTRGYYTEGRRYLEQILASPALKGVSLGRALYSAYFFAERQLDFPPAYTYVEKCLEVSKVTGDKLLQWNALYGMASMHCYLEVGYSRQGNFDLARYYVDQLPAVAKQLGSAYVGWAKQHVSTVMILQGEYEFAWPLLKEGEKLSRELGIKTQLLFFLEPQARLSMILEDFEGANHFLEEIENISNAINLHLGKLTAYSYRGIICSYQGKFEKAHQYLEESLVLCLQGGMRQFIACSIVGVAVYLSQVWQNRNEPGQPEKLACLCGAVWSVAGAPNAKAPIMVQPMSKYFAEISELARSQMGEVNFEKSFEKGHAMLLEEAISYARQVLNGL